MFDKNNQLMSFDEIVFRAEFLRFLVATKNGTQNNNKTKDTTDTHLTNLANIKRDWVLMSQIVHTKSDIHKRTFVVV